MSEAVKALAAALPKIANPGKDGKSHHGAFTTLAHVLDHVKPILAEHGLAVLQEMDDQGVRTVFVHESGARYDCGTYPVGHYAKPQEQGSAITYARRYSLMAALGVAGVDDDANTAQRATQPRQKAPKSDDALSPAQLKALQASWSSVRRADRLAAWADIIGRQVGSANELTKDEASKIMETGGPDV